jgi:hypothetical protein
MKRVIVVFLMALAGFGVASSTSTAFADPPGTSHDSVGVTYFPYN